MDEDIRKKLEEDFEKKMREVEIEMQIQNRRGDNKRARSVSVGTCFGGQTELLMRANDSSVVWAPMNPVEVVELIHQLAANVGCHIHIQPRNDFASWRKWKVEPHMNPNNPAFPPFVNDMAPFTQLGANMSQHLPGLSPKIEKDNENEKLMAIEKPKNRRTTKRSSNTP